MHMVTFLAGIPEDKVTGNENTLTGHLQQKMERISSVQKILKKQLGEKVKKKFPLISR